MKFRTQIEIAPFEAKIDYSDNILAVGSCFAATVGGKLARSRFKATVNPTGVLFNPASIAQTLQRFEHKRFVTLSEIQEGATPFHYDFHSSLCAPTPSECVAMINQAVELGHEALMQSDWIIVTLGTAWVYELARSGEVVANCHKQPAVNFIRRRLSVSEIVDMLNQSLSHLLTTKKVILTLSPVRHVGDGLSENSLSKATLRVAIEEFVSQHPSSVYYFPAYEIFVDDLRDYRFYAEDMVHPSSVGVDYVWDKFRDVALSLDSLRVMEQVESVIRAAEHRPVNPLSDGHRRFCEAQLRAIEGLSGSVDLSEMRQYFTL
ncbi:MAG: GSCFA domain-containing protein [Rikenellaceae bacterium]